jgi:hypothetical protein
MVVPDLERRRPVAKRRLAKGPAAKAGGSLQAVLRQHREKARRKRRREEEERREIMAWRGGDGRKKRKKAQRAPRHADALPVARHEGLDLFGEPDPPPDPEPPPPPPPHPRRFRIRYYREGPRAIRDETVIALTSRDARAQITPPDGWRLERTEGYPT